MKIRKYTIGRSPDNDEVINEPDVSGHHAVIFILGDVVSIDDLNSSNGTYHNGYKVKTAVLQRNSEVKIANKYSLNLLPFFENYNSDFQLDADNNYVKQFDELESVWTDRETKRRKSEKMIRLSRFATSTVLHVIPCIFVAFYVKKDLHMPISLILATTVSALLPVGENVLKKKDKKQEIEFKSRYKCPRCGVQLYEDWQVLKNQKECFHCKAIWTL